MQHSGSAIHRDTIQCNTVGLHYTAIQYNRPTVHRNTIQHNRSAINHNTIQHNGPAIHRNTIQWACNTLQYNTMGLKCTAIQWNILVRQYPANTMQMCTIMIIISSLCSAHFQRLGRNRWQILKLTGEVQLRVDHQNLLDTHKQQEESDAGWRLLHRCDSNG